jgi:hypothetical protein
MNRKPMKKWLCKGTLVAAVMALALTKSSHTTLVHWLVRVIV